MSDYKPESSLEADGRNSSRRRDCDLQAAGALFDRPQAHQEIAAVLLRRINPNGLQLQVACSGSRGNPTGKGNGKVNFPSLARALFPLEKVARKLLPTGMEWNGDGDGIGNGKGIGVGMGMGMAMEMCRKAWDQAGRAATQGRHSN